MKLPSPDCTPVKLRLLGEDLVAFRATSGRVGVIDPWCPHRNANLFWGRNEEDGLRCVYHGWKFDVAGNCVDMPNEPASSVFANKVRITGLPGADGGGLIWVYMGDREKRRRCRDLEFNCVPESHRLATKRIQALQLPAEPRGRGRFAPTSRSCTRNLRQRSARVRHDAGATPTAPGLRGPGDGLRAWRSAPVATRGPNKYYWRITQFILPTYTIIPATAGRLRVHRRHPDRRHEHDRHHGGLEHGQLRTAGDGRADAWTSTRTSSRSRTRATTTASTARTSACGRFTGIKGIRIQDMAVQEDQRGPVSDRSREHLGTSDLGVIATRRRLQKQMRDLMEGHEPREPHTPEAFHLHSLAITADRSIPWEQLMREHMVLTKTPLATETAV